MSEPNVKGPFIVEIKKSGLMSTSISKQLAFWEMDSDDETKADHVVVDAVGSPKLEYKDIPAVVNFLEKVYRKRVVNDERDLNVCPHCHARYP